MNGPFNPGNCNYDLPRFAKHILTLAFIGHASLNPEDLR